VLFFEVGLEDRDILEVIRGEGHKLGKYTFVRLRLELGLQRRIYGRAAQDQANRLVRERGDSDHKDVSTV